MQFRLQPRPLCIAVGSVLIGLIQTRTDAALCQATRFFRPDRILARDTFIAEVAAGPVYRLLGKKSLSDDSGPTDAFPPVGTALLAGDLAFVQHPGGHNPQPSFATFLEFATRYMTPAASAKTPLGKGY